MSELREVKVGGRSYAIQAFSPRKVFLAGKLVGKLEKTARKVTKETAAYRKEYRQENAQVITRAMAAMPPWSGSESLSKMTPEEWERAGGQVEFRPEPPEQELVLVMLGAAVELAEEEVLRLLALVVIPNDELAEAARSEGGVNPALARHADRFLDEAHVGEFVDLIEAAVETVREEMAGKMGKLRKLRGMLTGETPEAQENEKRQESEDRPEETSKTRLTSSTDSPASITGPTETALTGSPTG